MITNKVHSEELIQKENKYNAHNYHPIPVVIEKGEGVYVWDCEGKKYFDFLAAYSAINQGHCHPEIVKVAIEQISKLTLVSRAFYNSELGNFSEYISNKFGFDKILPMNSGAEAVETAIKLLRKWAYNTRNIVENEAVIVICDGNFHGRTTTIISFSSDEDSKKHFGPFTPGFINIPYNDTDALSEAFHNNKNIIGFLVEPIQGEAGVIVPNEGYLKKCLEICHQNNALMICDEIQTGLGRTGKMMAYNYDNIQPDIVTLGKALSGGIMPISIVMANDNVMNFLKPGEHGSTFGGNPLACKVAMSAIDVLENENMIENSFQLGEYFRTTLSNNLKNTSLVKEVRGKGMMNAIEINDIEDSTTAWDICIKLKENGLLAKPTHGNIIRFSPPLILTKIQIDECVQIISNVLINFLK